MNDILKLTLATIALAVCFHVGMSNNFESSKDTMKVKTYQDYVATNGNDY